MICRSYGFLVCLWFPNAIILNGLYTTYMPNLLCTVFFISFQLQYNKKYEQKFEDEKRLQIFIANKLYIAKHNQLYEKGELTYSLEMNRFGDWTEEEIDEKLYGFYDIMRW